MLTSYRTLIIDDEEPARIGLTNLLAQFKDTFTLVGTAANGIEAKEKIEELNPDLIFLDIEMPECSGFQMLAQLKTLPIVVFCTAYNQYALQAFETNSIDYIVKPVKAERIAKTVQKLQSFQKNSSQEDLLQVLKDISAQKQTEKMTSITVKKKDRLLFIKLEQVAYFESDNNYTNIYSDSGVHLSNETITSLVEKLPNNFIRVHRGIIINKDYVKDIQTYFNSRFIFSLQDKNSTKLTSGRSYNEVIKQWINQ
jgi:DNA-binding LytR/AlgR family response regulator